MPILSVNIDHVATVREARRTVEPDPLQAAAAAQRGGAAGITVHLREDRRHIQDDDVRRLSEVIEVPLNFEMAATEEMIAFAIEIRPQSAMIVPEGRAEITTEGGLDVVSQADHLRPLVERLKGAGIPSSAFIDAVPDQVKAAADCGFAVCEVHTGPWSRAFQACGYQMDCPEAATELARVAQTGQLITEAGMRFNAGHALDYHNVQPIAILEGLCELHIGHAIVSRSIMTGIQEAVREMVSLINTATP